MFVNPQKGRERGYLLLSLIPHFARGACTGHEGCVLLLLTQGKDAVIDDGGMYVYTIEQIKSTIPYTSARESGTT